MHRNSSVCALSLVLAALMLLSGCAAGRAPAASPSAAPALTPVPGYEKFTGYFYDAFDTVTVLTGFAQSREEFDDIFTQAHALFMRYHAVFDAYAAHEGVNGLYYINKNAAQEPVTAEREMIDLLLWLKEMQPSDGGTVNVAMGAVLSLWHDYREEGVSLPPEKLLRNAAKHTDFNDVIVDGQAGTVYYADPEIRLDLGAVAKGYAVEIVSEWLLTTALSSYIISAGGNVRCGEKPLDGRARWGVSIQNPDEAGSSLDADAGYLDVLYLTNASVVTSGDYQRYYTVDGVNYHHIIDPATLYPAQYMRAVTIVAEDSGLADFLSTAVFLMPYAQGRAFVDAMPGAEAYWVLADGSVEATDGMRALMRSEGASARD